MVQYAAVTMERLVALITYLLIQGIVYSLKAMNLRHMMRHGDTIPEGFEGSIDHDALRRTLAYTIDRTRFGFSESMVEVAAVLLFLYGGLLDRFNSWVVSLRLSFVLEGLVFFFLLGVMQAALAVPFNLYSTFRIENRYGFNTMTGRLWLADFMKSASLSAVLAGIVLGGCFWIVQAWPQHWWLLVWGFFFLFSVLMLYVSPSVIEPLFNTFRPLDGDGLEGKIRALMGKAGIRVSRVFVVDASRRSRHTNAYFTGIGRVKRIVLYDTLLESMDGDELLAVLAHEAGHWKSRHVLKTIVLFEVLSLAGAYLSFLLLGSDRFAEIFLVQTPTFSAKLVVLSFFFSIGVFPLRPLFASLSRRYEREADRFAVRLSGTPGSLATALIKLSRENLSNLHPHPAYAGFFSSHPPVVERVKMLRGMAEAGG